MVFLLLLLINRVMMGLFRYCKKVMCGVGVLLGLFLVKGKLVFLVLLVVVGVLVVVVGVLFFLVILMLLVCWVVGVFLIMILLKLLVIVMD